MDPLKKSKLNIAETEMVRSDDVTKRKSFDTSKIIFKPMVAYRSIKPVLIHSEVDFVFLIWYRDNFDFSRIQLVKPLNSL